MKDISSRTLRLDYPALANVFAAFPEVLLAYVFGSQARGEAHLHSDVDFGVLLAGGVHAHATLDLQLRLMAELSAVARIPEVDVVVLNTAPIALAYRVVHDGHRLFVRDEDTRILYEAQVAVRYIDFKPIVERHERAILERARRGELLDGYNPHRGALERYRRLRASLAGATED